MGAFSFPNQISVFNFFSTQEREMTRLHTTCNKPCEARVQEHNFLGTEHSSLSLTLSLTHADKHTHIIPSHFLSSLLSISRFYLTLFPYFQLISVTQRHTTTYIYVGWRCFGNKIDFLTKTIDLWQKYVY